MQMHSSITDIFPLMSAELSLDLDTFSPELYLNTLLTGAAHCCLETLLYFVHWKQCNIRTMASRPAVRCKEEIPTKTHGKTQYMTYIYFTGRSK